MSRYARQLALPEFSQAHQNFLRGIKLLMVGAGGLGASALPWLAGAGIGHITIADSDTVDMVLRLLNPAGPGAGRIAVLLQAVLTSLAISTRHTSGPRSR